MYSGGETTLYIVTLDSKYCLTGTQKKAKLWNIETGKCIHNLKGHENFITSVAFSPDGKYCLTRSLKTANLWSVETGKCIYALKEHTSTITSVAFSPDGKYFLICHDCMANLLDMETQKVVDVFYHVSGVNVANCDFSGVNANNIVKKILYQNGAIVDNYERGPIEN